MLTSHTSEMQIGTVKFCYQGCLMDMDVWKDLPLFFWPWPWEVLLCHKTWRTGIGTSSQFCSMPHSPSKRSAPNETYTECSFLTIHGLSGKWNWFTKLNKFGRLGSYMKHKSCGILSRSFGEIRILIFQKKMSHV